MAREQANQHEMRNRSGAGLLVLGLVALAAELAFLATPLSGLFDKATSGVFGVLSAIGLSLLQAAQAVAFGQVDYFSLISRILVLFLAMVAVVVGIVLMRSRTSEPAEESISCSSDSREQGLE